MRLLFIGASQFGLRALKATLSLQDVEVVGIITNMQEFSISYSQAPVKNVLYASLQTFGLSHNIPSYTMQKNMKEVGLLDFIAKLKPDFALVVGWYHMIPKTLLEKFPFAGLHASLLPKYSGGAPLVWAMINGEDKAGITFFLFDTGVDNGPIIDQKAVAIKQKDTIKTLYRKIEKAGINLLEKNLPKIANGTVQYTKQNESLRTIFRQRSPKDGRINWRWSSQRINRFIKAQTKPYPGAFTYVGNKKLILWDADVIDIAKEEKLQ